MSVNSNSSRVPTTPRANGRGPTTGSMSSSTTSSGLFKMPSVSRSTFGLRQAFKAAEPQASTSAAMVAPSSPEKPSFVQAMLRTVSGSKGKAPAPALQPPREALQSYLRVRAAPDGGDGEASKSYVEILSDTEIRLHGRDHSPTNSLLGLAPGSGGASSTVFAFSRVFGPTTSQAEFFETTTLPLVRDLLEGSSALLFAYGVTASGKTYTVQGDTRTAPGVPAAQPGLLPRTLDVLFNSIGGRASCHAVKPARVGVTAVEPIGPGEHAPPKAISVDPSSVRGLGLTRSDSLAFNLAGGHTRCGFHEDAALETSRDYEYAVWISYAEIHNEKVYDLLDAPGIQSPSLGGMTHSSSTVQLSAAGLNATTSMTVAAAMASKRKALSIKHDGKSRYIHGLKEIRVFSSEEGREVMRKGQINRSVFSTLLNRTSSRSHSIFTIKLVRIPHTIAHHDVGGAIKHAHVTRLCVVDLAGSERTRHTGTTGDRLKEAGNINKSLMVLGQCMDVLRQNQLRDPTKTRAAPVPYRHSKLTETFSTFFEGDGRAVMVVCVNPTDTGFEENANVMQFSAVAKQVTVARSPVIHSPLPVPSPSLPPTPRHASAPPPAIPRGKPPPLLSPTTVFLPVSHAPDVSILTETDEDDEGGYATAADETATSHAALPSPTAVPAEDEQDEEEDEDEDDGFVDHLLGQIAALRIQLVEQEIKQEAREARVRDALMGEMAAERARMETIMSQRLAETETALELKWTRKLELYERMMREQDESEDEDDDLSGSADEPDTEPENGDALARTIFAPTLPLPVESTERASSSSSEPVAEAFATARTSLASGVAAEDVPPVPTPAPQPSAPSTPIAKRPTRTSTRQSKAKQPVKQLILADSDGATDCASDADTAPAESPRPPARKATGGIVASRSAALNELKAGRQSRASTRNAAASPVAAKPTAAKATRKSTRTGVRPAVKDRIRALEQATMSDGDASLVIDSSTLKPKKRKLGTKASVTDFDELTETLARTADTASPAPALRTQPSTASLRASSNARAR